MNTRQAEKFSRQILLEEVGEGGQERLLQRGICIHGSSPALSAAEAYLTAAGCPLVPSSEAFVHVCEGDALPAQSMGKRFAALVVAMPRGIAYRSPVGDENAFASLREALADEPKPSAESQEMRGALIALSAQRILLELAPEGVGSVLYPSHSLPTRL